MSMNNSNIPLTLKDYQENNLQVSPFYKENQNKEKEPSYSNKLYLENEMRNIPFQDLLNNNLNLQSKYQEIPQILQNSLQETSNIYKPTKQTKCISSFKIILCLAPLLISVGIIMILLLNRSIKKVMVHIFQNLQGQLNFLNIICLIIFGVLSIFLSLPYAIFEISLGVTFPFFIGLLIGFTSKLLGQIICFYLTRTFLKKCILSYLESDLVFQILLKASLKHPNTVQHFLRSSLILPSFLVNYGSGILHISYQQYLIPAVFWGIVYSCCWIFVGQELVMLSEVVNSSFIPKNKILFCFQLSLVIASVIAPIIVMYKARKVYEDLKEEVEWQETLEQEKKMEQVDLDYQYDCPAKNIGKYNIENISRNNLISIGFSSYNKTVYFSQLQCNH